MRTELAQLKPTASHTELGQLDEPALEKGTFSLELSTAHFAETSISLGGPSFFISWAQGGVLKVEKLVATSLTLDSLMPCFMLGSSLAWSFHPERKLALSKLSSKHFSDGPCGTVVPRDERPPVPGTTGQNGDFAVEL